MKNLLIGIALLITVASSSSAQIIFTTPHGVIDQGKSLSINSQSSYAFEFDVTQTTHINDLLVQMASGATAGNTFLAVLVAVSPATQLPVGNPYNPAEVVASASFTALGGQPANVVIPLSTTIKPGDYDIILSASNSTGFLQAYENPAIGESFFNNVKSWQTNTSSTTALSVEGQVVPETMPAIALLGFAGALLVFLSRAHYKITRH